MHNKTPDIHPWDNYWRNKTAVYIVCYKNFIIDMLFEPFPFVTPWAFISE